MDNTTPFQPWADDENSKNVKLERELVDDAKLHRENVNHPKHGQTASYDKEIVDAPSVVPGPSSGTGSGANPVGGKEPKMDSGQVASMQQIVENTLSQEGRQRVSQILEAVEALSGAERLLLYLRLPTGVPPHDPLKQPINPLGSRAELQQTVTWIQTHLEVDPDVSLPKQDVYDEYIAHCMSSNMKPLSTADFGKVMKQVYPSVRPRRLGTRGNSRYCYAGLRKKVKLEVPQLPDLGESSKEPTMMKESERIVCEWAESKFGMKFVNLTALSRHLVSPLGAASASPPPHTSHGQQEETSSPQLMKQQLKRKLQTHGTPGRPKKNKGQEVAGESPPSTSYVGPHASVKHESDAPEPSYGYPPAYAPAYDVRQPFPYAPPPRAHPLPPHAPPPALPHDYRADPYAFEPYAPRDLSVPDTAHNLPINLSSDASLDLSTERHEWRRRPPDPPHAPPPHAPPPPARLPLPGKKLILETYQSETQGSPRAAAHRPPEEFPRAEYLPKKMRAAEILGGKLAAARMAPASSSAAPAAPAAPAEPPVRTEVAFLEDPKNLTSRSKSTAAALAREEQEAASPTRAVKAPTPRCSRARMRGRCSRARGAAERPERAATPDSCCGLDGINIRTGVICEEKHSEILNRERVISICNIDKHALDDYLNEGNSQEHEEELLQYFHRDDEREPAPHAPPAPAPHAPHADPPDSEVAFLETGQDPHDDHSQGKSEKISQLRELLAKNLKNQSGSNTQNDISNTGLEKPLENGNEPHVKTTISEGAFRPLGNGNVADIVNGANILKENEVNASNNCDTLPHENGISTCTSENNHNQLMSAVTGHLYNGNCHTEPQSPTTRTQQYDFVPISDGCQSPGNFHSKSPLGFGQRGHSPSKTNKPIMMGGSLQTSPISHSTAASFVSPRNTPVPRSRFCSRPIPKHNGRKKRLTLGVTDPCSNQFAMPNDQKFMPKTSLSGSNIKYCQPMSAPPSPNILSQYKQQMVQNSGIPNGGSNMCLSFMPNAFRDNMNGELAQPLSADPLSSEVSRFFQEPMGNYRVGHDTFRSQSVPLKQAPMNIGLLSYNNTPVGSVPPTPVPNEFCDFGSLADTCDISKAGLNPETLDKIYDAIDSSNGVLNTGTSTDIMTNGCDPLPDQQILTDDQLHSLMPNNSELLGRSGQYSEPFPNDASADNVEEFLKRTNSIEYDLSEMVTEKNKYYTSRSVPSTPLPYKRTAPNLQIDSRLSRELFTADNNYSNISNGISSKSVPSTPQLAEERSVFSYSNRDFLINGNSVDMCNSNQMRSVENDQGLTSPLDMLREDILVDPLTPSIDPLLADLDKMDGTPYVDL